MRLLDSWVCWKFEQRDGKRTKVPYHPCGKRALATDSRSWSTFSAVSRADFEGVGFVFSDRDPYSGVDFDGCMIDGEMHPSANRLVEALSSYTEVTPSGNGLHVIVRGRWNGRRNRTKHTGWSNHLEIYDRARFFTMTGGLGEITYRQAWLDLLAHRMVPVAVPLPPVPTEVVLPNDQDLLGRALKNPTTAALWRGDVDAYSGDRSAADLALCQRLAFFTGPDPARIDRLFRSSGLMRFKWSERRGDTTYGRQTVGNALKRTTSYFGASKPLLVGNPFATASAANVGKID